MKSLHHLTFKHQLLSDHSPSPKSSNFDVVIKQTDAERRVLERVHTTNNFFYNLRTSTRPRTSLPHKETTFGLLKDKSRLVTISIPHLSINTLFHNKSPSTNNLLFHLKTTLYLRVLNPSLLASHHMFSVYKHPTIFSKQVIPFLPPVPKKNFVQAL